MGLATVVQTEWGYYVTGDTDPTPVWSDGSRRYIRAVVFSPNGTDDYAILSTTRNITGPSTNFLRMGSAGVAKEALCPWHLDEGVPADNLTVQMTHGGAQLFIVVK